MSDSAATEYQAECKCGTPTAAKQRRPPKALDEYASMDDIRQHVLKQINKYRRYHKANSLVLLPALNQHAQQWAEHLAEHQLLETRANPSCGESIISVDKPLFCVRRLIKLWYQEKYKYDFSKPDYGVYTGHFTQLVWQGSKQLGVGIAPNEKRILLVCNYFPPGNIRGQYAQHVHPRQPLAYDFPEEQSKSTDKVEIELLPSAVTLKQ